MLADLFEFAIETPELLGCSVDVGRQRTQFVAIADLDAPAEVARSNLVQSGVDLADRPDQRPRDRPPEDQRERDGADREGDDDHLRGAVGRAGRLDVGHDIGLGLVDQFVGQPFEPVRQRPGLLQLRFAGLGDMPASDQSDDPRRNRDKPVVFLPHLVQQLDLVLGDELQPLEVIAELVQLTQRAGQGALVRDQERRRDAVKLARGVVLDLAVGGDLALAVDQLFGAPVDPAELVQPDRAERDQQCDDREKRRQQLCLDTPRQARDRADEERVERDHSVSTRLSRSRRNSSGLKRQPIYCTRIRPSASTSVVS